MSGNGQGRNGQDGGGAERRGPEQGQGQGQGQGTAPPLADWPHPVPAALPARVGV
jgi:hypothetical protein